MMPGRPPLLCGLLCRFLSTRFVACTRHGLICQVGAHGSTSAVGVHIEFLHSTIKCTVTIKPETGNDIVRAFSCSLHDVYTSVGGSGVDSDVVFTSAVARWACPQLMRTTFIQIPRSGLRGCVSATSTTIGAATMSFSGKNKSLYHHDTHTATADGVSVVFRPRYITVVAGTTRDVVYIAESVSAHLTTHNGKECYLYFDREVNGPNNVDEVIVQTCRVMDVRLSGTRHARSPGRAMRLCQRALTGPAQALAACSPAR